MSEKKRDQYFATLTGDELVSELTDRIKNFHDWIERTGQGRQWRRSYDLYYGNHVDNDGEGSQVQHVGEDEELTAFGVNHYRNLVKHVLALTCSSKPSYDFRARNSDTRASQQARLANNIIDSYLVEKRLGRHQKQAAERALVYKVGYTYTIWNTSLGKPYTVKEVEGENGEIIQKVVHEGDAEICSLSPWHVGYDPNLRDWSKNKWCWVRNYENKFDVATQYPDQYEKIIDVDCESDLEFFDYAAFSDYDMDRESESELIPVYEFYHLPTASVPQGKYVKFLAGGIILYEGPYQYRKRLPVQRITPGEKFDSAQGFTEFSDIMVLQQVYNILCSTMFTNQSAFGTQAIWLPEGCNLAAEQIGKGLSVFKGGLPGTEPKAIQLTATPAEIFKNADMIKSNMELLSGVNSTVRGDPEQNLKSGAALGRLQAMAIQFSSNFQQAWAELLEDGGTFLLYILQDYAQTERMVAIAGKYNRSAMKAWTGKDIDMIDMVTCDLGNPAARTYAGRMDLADKLLEKGEVNGKQYIQVMQTGQIESALEGPEAKIELARKENEMLNDGKLPNAMAGEPHILHAQEHGAILADPELKFAAENGDPVAKQIVENTLKHIMDHKMLHETQDPFWFVVSGEEPPPPQGPPPPGPGGPPMGPPPEGGPGAPMPPPPVGPPMQPPEAPPIPELPPGV